MLYSDAVVGINSPFPWAPGHSWQELEFLCYKKLVSNSSRIHIFPLLESPISTAIVSKYSGRLQELGIYIAQKPLEIATAFAESEPIDISLSNVKYLRRGDIPASHYQLSEETWLYTRLIDEFKRHSSSYESFSSLAPCLSSMQAIHCDYQDFNELYSSHGAPLEKCIQIDSRIANEIASKGRRLVIVNIQQHVGNARSGHTVSQFEPLFSYLRDSGYIVVDVSHDKKSSSVMDLCIKYDVIPYWSFEDKSHLIDIELFSLADFYVGAGGITHLALMLRIPSIWVGSYFPFHIASVNGYQLPCNLRRRIDNSLLSVEDLFSAYLDVPELWQDKYDSFLNKYGKFNPFNCNDEIQHLFSVIPPSSISILKTFITLESTNVSNSSEYMIKSSRRDLYGRPYQFLRTSPYL